MAALTTLFSLSPPLEDTLYAYTNVRSLLTPQDFLANLRSADDVQGALRWSLARPDLYSHRVRDLILATLNAGAVLGDIERRIMKATVVTLLTEPFLDGNALEGIRVSQALQDCCARAELATLPLFQTFYSLDEPYGRVFFHCLFAGSHIARRILMSHRLLTSAQRITFADAYTTRFLEETAAHRAELSAEEQRNVAEWNAKVVSVGHSFVAMIETQTEVPVPAELKTLLEAIDQGV